MAEDHNGQSQDHIEDLEDFISEAEVIGLVKPLELEILIDGKNKVIDCYKKLVDRIVQDLDRIEKMLQAEDLEIKSQIEENRKSRKAIKDIMIIRQAISSLFNDLWQEHKQSLQSQAPDFNGLWQEYKHSPNFNDLAQQTSIFEQPGRARRIDGLKYALCELNGFCDHVSKDLCRFYIAINSNPKPRPKEIILDSLEKLKELMKQGEIPTYHVRMGLTIKVLEDLEPIVRSR